MNSDHTRTRTSRRKRGRPSRSQASERALKGIDVRSCDPKVILQTIAMDTSAPASARATAAKALLRAAAAVRAPEAQSEEQSAAADLNERALVLLRGGRAT